MELQIKDKKSNAGKFFRRGHRITGVQWVPISFALVGGILNWIHIDEQALILNIGFVSFGLVTLVDCVKKRYYQRINLEPVHILSSLLIIMLALQNILSNTHNFALIGVTIWLQLLIEQRHLLMPARN